MFCQQLKLLFKLCNNDSYCDFEFQESTAPIDLSGHFLSFSEETGEEEEIRQRSNNSDVLSVDKQSDQTLSDKSCRITVSNDNILNNSVGCCHDENKENNCYNSSYVELNGYISPLVFHTIPRNSPQVSIVRSVVYKETVLWLKKSIDLYLTLSK